MRRAHHLHDDRLFDCYVADRGGEPIDPPTAEHLADCRACAAKFSELASFMDALRVEGEAEADAVFTPERLRAQQQQIARRLEHVGRHARVISFPGQFSRTAIGTMTTRTSSRWVAAAAAAGLFIGIALGASYEWEARAHTRSSTVIARDAGASRPRLTPVGTRGNAAQIAADDAFLSDLEVALERPRTRELLAYDAFTPHVREVSAR
jgi:anti-sigma factor RsiW